MWAAGSHLLEWFWEIDGGRTMTAGMSATIINPVGPLGIEAWARVTGTAVSVSEGRILLEMDRARVAGPKEAVDSEPTESQSINVAIFDAMLG